MSDEEPWPCQNYAGWRISSFQANWRWVRVPNPWTEDVITYFLVVKHYKQQKRESSLDSAGVSQKESKAMGCNDSKPTFKRWVLYMLSSVHEAHTVSSLEKVSPLFSHCCGNLTCSLWPSDHISNMRPRLPTCLHHLPSVTSKMMGSTIMQKKIIHGLVWLLGFDLVDETVSNPCAVYLFSFRLLFGFRRVLSRWSDPVFLVCS